MGDKRKARRLDIRRLASYGLRATGGLRLDQKADRQTGREQGL